jgi:hypothetical protein
MVHNNEISAKIARCKYAEYSFQTYSCADFLKIAATYNLLLTGSDHLGLKEKMSARKCTIRIANALTGTCFMAACSG